MEKADTFIVEDNPTLGKLADNCARLWNEVNFERRQAYIHYRKYAPLIGSATAQQKAQNNH